MLRNTKGLSAVVGTILIILLVIVAVGIIWAVASGLFKGGGAQLELGVKCNAVDLDAVASCNATSGNCTVTLNRGAGGEDFAGVKLVFSNDTSSNIVTKTDNIGALLMKQYTEVDTGIENASKLEVTVYFEDEAGAEDLCPQPAVSVTL